MDVTQAVLEAGGIASSKHLIEVASRRELEAALSSGSVIRLGRGNYSLPDIDEHRRAAASLHGVLHRVSAARHLGWKVTFPPERPQVLVPRGRNVSAARREGIDLRWGKVSADELKKRVTSPIRTVLDCARFEPFDSALAVADSALRAGVSQGSLLLECQRLPRQGRARVLRVVELATSEAANPFESVARAILDDIEGAAFKPQVWIDNIGRADLVDRALRIVVECDSWEFHGNTEAFHRDMVRYNAFVCAGHVVLRFGWRHVMFEQDYVRETVRAVVAAQEGSLRRCARCAAA